MPNPRVLATAAALALACAFPAFAQVDDRAWEECKRNPEPDWIVFNCTAVIEGAGDQSKTRRARALVQRSAAYVRKKEPDKARADLSRAVSLAPDNPDILTARADFLFVQGEIEGAAEDYRQAVEIDPRHARALFGMAGIARQRGDVRGAIAELDKVLAIEPRFPRARALRQEWGKAGAGS
ncbi:tetratricopeptide repeat protein [uncultured Alsobacter sp.]|uniref:tetratricopeptide repeat protein n=1 Tax=uncultured Alsobacter sp. TaxID=1748258 RepID=UPI0025E8EA55|nr:tetratricopeptide repeat protein [uncultured Alsobacter sp.]